MPDIPVSIPLATPKAVSDAAASGDRGSVTILIEADEPNQRAGKGGFRAVNPAASLAEKLVDGALPFERVSTAVHAIAGQLVSALDGLANQPDKVTVDFGIKLSGDANILIAKGSGEANLKLTLQWGK
ncbi:MAG: CU044_2847 family protein [Alphaproteobacteria bacterium]